MSDSGTDSLSSDLPGFVLESKGPENPPLPPDILAALDIVNGNVQMENSPGRLNANGSPFDKSAQDRFQDALIKKEELEKARSFAEDFEVHCLDLADPEDRKTYSEILSKVYALGSKFRFEQTPIQNFVDKHSPKGFRAIITVTLFKQSSAVPKDSKGIEFIKIGDNGKTSRISVPQS